jgi:hypothetical protein
MTDPNLKDFYGRVARIQKAHSKGYGFESAGTLGRSYYSGPAAQRRSVLGPVLFFLLCTFLLKGIIYHSIGPESYDERVAALRAGEGIERAGGWLMQAEPATMLVADLITVGLGQLR